MRTSAEPARARGATCWMVDSASLVSVLVTDWTTTGASDPTRMPPMLTVTAWRRWIDGMGSFYQWNARKRSWKGGWRYVCPATPVRAKFFVGITQNIAV